MKPILRERWDKSHFRVKEWHRNEERVFSVECAVLFERRYWWSLSPVRVSRWVSMSGEPMISIHPSDRPVSWKGSANFDSLESALNAIGNEVNARNMASEENLKPVYHYPERPIDYRRVSSWFANMGVDIESGD